MCVLDRQAGACLRDIAGAIGEAFGVEIHPVLIVADLSAAREPGRSQLDAAGVLKIIGDVLPPSEEKVLAVTMEDLYTPVLSFVLGEAELGGRLAVMSLHRMRDSFYGLPDIPGALLQRARKESIHEVGHTFGLTHCASRLCPMHPSTCAEELDFRSSDLCRSCHRKVFSGRRPAASKE